jgi:hypothetical protein
VPASKLSTPALGLTQAEMIVSFPTLVRILVGGFGLCIRGFPQRRRLKQRQE